MRILQTSRTTPVTHLDLAADGRTLVAGGAGGFDVFDLSTGQSLPVPIPGVPPFFTFVLDPPGRWLYLSAVGTGFWIYDLALLGQRRRLVESVNGSDQHVISAAVSPDGARLALARGVVGNHRLECWAVADDGPRSLNWSLPAGSPHYILRSLAFDPRGDYLAYLDPDPSGAAVLRDAADGAGLRKLGDLPHIDRTGSAFTATGDQFAIWDDRGLHLFATGEARPPRTRRHVGQALFRLSAFHPSGRLVITVANDGVARYWDLATLTQTQAFAWKVGKLHCLALSPDGTLAAAGTDRGRVVLWDVDV